MPPPTMFNFYCAEKWPERKVMLLLGEDPAINIPMTLAKTFLTIGKFATTYKKNGIFMSWIERASFSDMKYPNHVLLLQNVFDKLTFNKPEQLRKMKFPGKEPDDPDQWSKLFFLIEENARPSLASCLGWGGRKKSPGGGKFPVE